MSNRSFKREPSLRNHSGERLEKTEKPSEVKWLEKTIEDIEPTTGECPFISTTKNLGEKLTTTAIADAMKRLAVKPFGSRNAEEFKTKSLRSFYNSALLRANVQQQEIKDSMFGHQRRGARSHYDYDEQTIKDSYAKAFEHLSMNGLQTRTDIAKLKEDLTKAKSDFWDKMSKSEAKNAELEKQVAEMQSGLEFLKKYIGLTDVVTTEDDRQRLLDLLERMRKGKSAIQLPYPSQLMTKVEIEAFYLSQRA